MNFNKLYIWLQNNYHPGSYVTMNDISNFAKMFCEFISKIIFFLHALWSIRHPDWIFFFFRIQGVQKSNLSLIMQELFLLSTEFEAAVRKSRLRAKCERKCRLFCVYFSLQIHLELENSCRI